MIPKQVTVGPYTYEVEVSETADEGQIVHEAQRIFISPNRGEDSTADTVLHEVLHSHFIITGLRDMVGEKQEERIITALSPLLLHTLRANPSLVKFLTNG